MESLHDHLHGKDHVIWDWNGTLLADLDHAITTVNRLLVEEKLAPTTLEEYKKHFGFPVVDYYKKLGFDISPENFLKLCDRFNRYFYEGLHRCELWPGVRETLTWIKSQGKMQSLLSASEHSMLLESVRWFKLEHAFDHVVGIHDKTATSKVGRGRELMSQVHITPEKTVLIGDTDHDLEVAQAMGIEVILVEHGHQCPTRLKAVHNKVVKVF